MISLSVGKLFQAEVMEEREGRLVRTRRPNEMLREGSACLLELLAFAVSFPTGQDGLASNGLPFFPGQFGGSGQTSLSAEQRRRCLHVHRD